MTQTDVGTLLQPDTLTPDVTPDHLTRKESAQWQYAW